MPSLGRILDINVDVVEIDIPFLLGLEAMDRHRLQDLTDTNEVERVGIGRDLGWK